MECLKSAQILLSIIFILTCIRADPTTSESSRRRKVMLMSFDGFRYDYIEKVDALGVKKNAFKIIASKGYRPKYGESVMPTKTFVNHFSLATGCYAKHHGIVDNKFYDPVFREVFSGSKQNENKWFATDKCEPLWNSVGRHEKKVGVYYWFGSGSISSTDKYVQNYGPFSMEDNLRHRLTVALNWLDKGRKSLVMEYFHQPDHAAHKHGIDSPEFNEELKEINTHLLWLLEEIEKRKLEDELNLILVSDHGMSNVPEENIVDLDKYLPTNAYRAESLHSNVFWNLWPKNGYTADQIYEKLKDVKHLRVHKKSQMPKRFHYVGNRRIAPVIVYAEMNWKMDNANTHITDKANHGYDNVADKMHPFFLAMGPSIKKGITTPTVFRNLDVYNLVALILRLDKPWYNDGNVDNVLDILKNPPSSRYLEEFKKYAKGKKPDEPVTKKPSLPVTGVTATTASPTKIPRKEKSSGRKISIQIGTIGMSLLMSISHYAYLSL